MLDSRPLRTFGSACAALAGYGAWAFFANRTYAFSVSLKAALTQGSYSFVLTLCMAWIMEWLYLTVQPASVKFPFTLITTCLMLYGSSWGINALLGTPEIVMTILPGAIIGSIYSLFYCLMLEKQRPIKLKKP